MIKRTTALALSAALLATTAHAETPAESVAWTITADLTTEVGARLAGTDREAAARDWAVAQTVAARGAR